MEFRYKYYKIRGVPKDNCIWIQIIGHQGGWAISFDEWDNFDFKIIAKNYIDNNFISNDKAMGRI